MFPLKTTEPIKRFPFITLLLIAANVYVFTQQLLVEDPVAFFQQWGLVPANYPRLFSAEAGSDLVSSPLLPFVTSMFLHGGWMHLLGNMLSLFVFGPNMEDRFGHTRFLAVYFACGLAAGITQIAFSAGSEIPIVGASGAIAGVMGAFFLMFPRARVVTLILIVVFPLIVRIPAFFYLLFWIGMNVVNAFSEIQLGVASQGVAWWAHIGGFAIGMVYAGVLSGRQRSEVE
jgi:membrane associated rhomboid family serine protease